MANVNPLLLVGAVIGVVVGYWLMHLIFRVGRDFTLSRTSDGLAALAITLVVYGQLILENMELLHIDRKVIEQIFDVMIRDFSKFAMQLYTKPGTTFIQQQLLKRMMKRPVVDQDRFETVWKTYVYAVKGEYEMNR